MKKTINDWIKALVLVLTVVAVLAISIWGVVGIYKDIEREPFYKVELDEQSEPLIREVLAWYYEDGCVEDEQGQLWWFDAAEEEGQMWRLWINDNGTPRDVTDDMVIDYTGG